MSKALTLKNIAALLLGAAIVLGLAFSFAVPAFANPYYIASNASTAAATTTLNYQAPGAATTTLVYDSYEQNGTNQRNDANYTVPNEIGLAIQGLASSSAVVNVACEYSNDNIDWYQGEIFDATSSNPVNIATPNSFTFAYTASTIGGVTYNGFRKVMTCPLPMRYVRAIITNTGAQIGVWAAFIPQKQRN